MIKTRNILVIGGIIVAISIISASAFLIGSQEEPKKLNENIVVQEFSCKCVAFRLDDIQNFPPDNLQYKVIDFFMEKKIPLNIGIIGNLFPKDSYVVEYVNEQLEKNGEYLEISNHGWKHEDFTKFSKDEQSKLIKQTNDVLLENINVKTTLFIPPYNRFNEDTITALEENQMTHMSSVISLYESPMNPYRSGMYHFPSTSTTGEYGAGQIWTAWTGQKTFAFIEQSIWGNGFAVVMMHPRDFGQFAKTGNAVNLEQFEELELVINKIQDAGWKIVFLGEMNLN
jgi:predicted deacetylase